VASDGTRAARLEAEAQEWLKRLYARDVALEDLNPAPMPPAPPDGRCPRVSEWKSSCKFAGLPGLRSGLGAPAAGQDRP